jgi:carbon-monoxide dehydrogenase medium subunit
VKPPPFDYSAPDTLDEALDILAEVGDEARPLAGGQSLIPLLSLRLARPAHLIDLAGIAELQSISANGQLRIGAMTRERKAEADPRVRRIAPLLAEALPFIGHPAIRSRGTIGGSLAHADPAAELPAVALVSEASLVARSRDRGERTVVARDFFTGFFTTALEPDEILIEVRFDPPPPNAGFAMDEVARRHGDFAMVGVAAMVTVEGDRIAEARVALTGVGQTPVRVPEAEAGMKGQPPSAEIWKAAAEQMTGAIDPPADLHGSTAYRKYVAGHLIQRTLTRAADGARPTAAEEESS